MIRNLIAALAAWCLASTAAFAADPPQDPYAVSEGSWGNDYPDQYWLERIGLGSGEDSAWRELDDDAAEVIVAVIDTGLDWHHLDFDWSNIWRNSDEIPGNGRDDDGNGYADDLIGWDFFAENGRPWDHDGHGTFTSGIIAGTWNNGIGIAGINPRARIMVLKALNGFGNTRASYLAEAIIYATDNGARIINMSVGGPELTKIEAEAIRYATSRGVLIVVAAGNEGQSVDGYGIAGMEEVITVGSSGLADVRAPFSNYGAAVDLLAPGVDILSLRARRTDTLLDVPGATYEAGAAYVGDDKRYFRASGTSFSAPMVAGVASLLLSRNPEVTGEQLRNILLSSARDVGAPGVDRFSGYGILDASAAMAADPDTFVVATIDDVAVRRGAEGVGLAVRGTISASDLASARVEIGAGEEPSNWQVVLEDLETVDGDEIGVIPAQRFGGSSLWIIRLIVTNADGLSREARFRLELG